MIETTVTAHCDHREPTFQGSHYQQCSATIDIPAQNQRQPWLYLQDNDWGLMIEDVPGDVVPAQQLTLCPDHKE